MMQLVQTGLDKTAKEATVKRRLEEGIDVISSVKGIIHAAVQAVPQAAVAWVGVCLALEVASPQTKVIAVSTIC